MPNDPHCTDATDACCANSATKSPDVRVFLKDKTAGVEEPNTEEQIVEEPVIEEQIIDEPIAEEPSSAEDPLAHKDNVALTFEESYMDKAELTFEESHKDNEALTFEESYMDKAELTFEEKVEQACHLLMANPLNREMLYRILKACQNKRWLLYDLEDYTQSCPENTSATQPPYFLIKWLADADALEVFELDAHGEVVDPAQLEGLTEDEIDDIVEDYAFETSAVGDAAVEEFSPTHRLLALLDIVPERYSTYREVLELLQERQGFDKIDALLRGRSILMVGREPGDRPMQPSVFVDKLASAGGIVWNEGWQISEEGRELLAVIKERES